MNDDDKKLKDQIIFDAHPKLSEEFSKKTLDDIFINIVNEFLDISTKSSSLFIIFCMDVDT